MHRSLAALALAAALASPALAAETPPAPESPDYLLAQSTGAFLDALRAGDVQKALAARKNFSEFLKSAGTTPELAPILVAMYQVLSAAPADDPDAKELSHILPTAVYFLDHKLRFASVETTAFQGLTDRDNYSNPTGVKISKKLADGDPAFAAGTLAHELQHVYDMYAGRAMISESTELRGAKAGTLYFKLLKKTAPGKFAELRGSPDWTMRYDMQNEEACMRRIDEGLDSFVHGIYSGRCYHQMRQTLSRFSMVKELDPAAGVPAEVAILREEAEGDRKRIAELQARRRALGKRLESERSSALEKEFAGADEELSQAETGYQELDRTLAGKELDLARMRRELEWLRRKAGPRAEIDWFLQIDPDY